MSSPIGPDRVAQLKERFETQPRQTEYYTIQYAIYQLLCWILQL